MCGKCFYTCYSASNIFMLPPENIKTVQLEGQLWGSHQPQKNLIIFIRLFIKNGAGSKSPTTEDRNEHKNK